MTELYEKISDLIKTHPTEFWIVLISFVTIIVIGTIFLITKKRKKKEIESQREEEARKRKIEAEKLAKGKQLSDEIAVNLKRKIETEKKTKTTQTKASESKIKYKSTEKKQNNIKEPEVAYKPTTKTSEKRKEPIKAKPKVKSKEKLPEAKKEEKIELTKNLFVNYNLDLSETTEVYAVLRIPRKGSIVRSHRYGNTKRRGFKEDVFQKSIGKYFCSQFEVAGNVRLNTGKETRPFEPDIAIIEKERINNIRIDIEIDEPYAGLTRQPTHCKGDDIIRDTYFADRGWIVIRFSEYQVHTQEKECLKFIAQIINKIDSRYFVPNDLMSISDLKPEKLWGVVQAQKWEKAKYREHYLNHKFSEVSEEIETIERDFNEQEINEEKLVESSLIGILDKGKNIGFNKTNTYPRDKRVSFYPENHIYTIDNVPAPSASTIISKFFPEFDAYGKASSLSPNNPLYGLSVEEIVQTWKQRGTDAANLGTHLHEQIEKYYLKQPYEETEEFSLFNRFVKENPDIKPYRSEWRIFDDKYNIAGTIDLISKNGRGYEIYDWKRSKKVVNPYSGEPITIDKWGNCGVGNLSDIDNTSYNKYCLQQSLYRYILEKNYNLKITKMYLVVLYPDYDDYYKVEIPYWKERIEYILETL